MGNALFIIWRESAEAMLVVGILYAWLARQPDRRTGLRYLWGGVAAGLGLALLLALAVLGVATLLSDEAFEYFQAGLTLVACGLIVQMVFWMRRHGRTLKKDLETRMQARAERAQWWGMLVVVALAVGRETAETVVFLYGVGLQQFSPGQFLLILAIGVALAYLTFWLLQRGGRALSWRSFFRVSEILLLLLAGGLLVTSLEKLIALGALPPLADQIWNTTALLDDSTRFGGFVAAMTGYRAQPALLPVLALAVFWISVLLALREPHPGPKTAGVPGRQ
ncbi:MAG: FTR1 family protein [Burkholderiales bacterium]|nr:FTR1 family protein [Burkholderiales bacterium]